MYSYHEKVPYDPPDLSIKDKTFGLVSPEPFSLPGMSPLWTAVAYAAFDIALDPNKKEKEKKASLFYIYSFMSLASLYFQNEYLLLKQLGRV